MVIYESKVYDIATYLREDKHPGGRDILIHHLGKDITKFFNNIHQLIFDITKFIYYGEVYNEINESNIHTIVMFVVSKIILKTFREHVLRKCIPRN